MKRKEEKSEEDRNSCDFIVMGMRLVKNADPCIPLVLKISAPMSDVILAGHL